MATFTVEYLFKLRDQFTGPTQKIASATQKARGNIHGMGAAFNAMEAGANRAGAALTRLATKMRAMTTVGRGFAGGGVMAGIGGGVGMYGAKNAIQRFADYETALTDLRKVWTGSDAGYGQLVAGLKQLNGLVPLTRAELSKLAEEGVRAGVSKNLDPKELIDYTMQVARFATAFSLPINQASETLAKLRSQLDLTSPEFEVLGDLMNTVANKFSLSEKEILETMRRQAGLAKSIAGRQGLTDFVSISAAQLAAGTPKEVAATGLRTLIARLSAQPKPTQGALAALGLDPETVKRQLPKDLYGTIRDVLDRVAKLPDHERAGALSGLAGLKSFDAFSRLLGNMKLMDEVRGVVLGKDRLTMQDEYNRRITTMNSLFQITQNRLHDLSDSLVKEWEPTIRWGLDYMGDLAKNMEGNKWLANAAGAYAMISAFALALLPLGIIAMSLRALGPLLWAIVAPIRVLLPLVRGLAVGLAMGFMGPVMTATRMLGVIGGLAMAFRQLRAIAGKAIVFTILWEGSKLLMNWDKVKASFAEPLKVNVIWPDAPGWFKWIVGQFGQDQKFVAGKGPASAMNIPGQLNEMLGKLNEMLGKLFRSTPTVPKLPIDPNAAQKYLPQLPAAGGAGRFAVPGLSGGAAGVPLPVQRVQVQNDLNIKPGELTVRYEGPIGGPGSVSIGADRSRGPTSTDSGTTETP